MHTIISNNLIIEKPSGEILNWCNSNLILDNPEYKQMKRMGKDNVIKYKKIPETLCLYGSVWGRIELPFGCLYALWNEIKKGTYELRLNNAGDISIKNDSPTYEPFDYQEEAINAMIKAKGGILVSPCGSRQNSLWN